MSVIFVAMRKIPNVTPSVDSVTKTCDVCKEEVWVSKGGAVELESNPIPVWCMQCVHHHEMQEKLRKDKEPYGQGLRKLPGGGYEIC